MRFAEEDAVRVPELIVERRVVAWVRMGRAPRRSPDQLATVSLRARVSLVIEEIAARMEAPSARMVVMSGKRGKRESCIVNGCKLELHYGFQYI